MSRFLARPAIVSALVLAASATAGVAFAQQPADGAAVYRAACAQCHDQPTGRTPSREALRDRTADAVLLSLNGGSMAFNALTLSMAEKRAVAEYVSGKPLGSGNDSAGTCAAKTADRKSVV